MEKFPPEESAGETEGSVWKSICKRIDTKCRDRNSLKSTRSNSLNKASDQPMVECLSRLCENYSYNCDLNKSQHTLRYNVS